MLKKTLAATVVAGALLFGGASAASAANQYPIDEDAITVTDTTPGIGQTITITINIGDFSFVINNVTFTVSPSTGASLASLVSTATSSSSVTKPVSNDVASASFTASAAGTYTVTATDAATGTVLDTITLSVAAAAAGDPTLPSTGGELSTAALWVGAGALGLGGLAVVAATARRRAAQR
ncbi:LPXTG cell wall anchor domain-containing protein [Microbacterium sp. W1N]|uniref:LPXTG cell wall anchor domain-containing protein n=1 Tax=Microbacterium festucae TaxID=2977531 RepID=UPI0021C11B14|nr:LPXTG cell wall anchor domain-containing protein [Microbacterium festucae]MCT9819021.1 LPXTG cell wall anchor domain-containing protein [Microbacterium festucae]